MIIEILSIIILQVSMLFAISKLSNSNIQHKMILLVSILLYATIYYFLYPYISGNISTLLSFIYMFLISKIVFQLSSSDMFLYVVVVFVLGIMIDIVTMLVMSMLQINETINILNNGIYTTICTLVMVVFYFVIGINCYLRLKIINFKNILSKIKRSYIYLFAVITIYFILGSFCLKNMHNSYISMTILIISISIIVMISTFLIQQFQIKSLKESIKILTKNNDFYIKSIDDYRIIKHNLIANLNSVKSVGNKKTIMLVDDLIQKYSTNEITPRNIKDLPSGINGIIHQKIYNIKDPNVQISINNKINNNIIEVLSPKKYNLFCEAIGVILDNAIEATITSNEKILFINIYEKENSIILKVINTFTGTIDVEKLGTKNYTSKSKGNGIGLYSILRNKDVIVSTSIKGNKFICTLNTEKEI